MTTAHRPTWKAAVGKAQEGGWSSGGGAPSTARSILDAPAHTQLKTRNDAHALQSTEREEILKKSLLKIREMEEKSSRVSKGIGRRIIDEKVEEEGRRKLLMSKNDVDEVRLKKMYDDEDDDGGGEPNGENGRGAEFEDVIHVESDLDASDSDADSDSDEDSDDESDDEDEEDLLQAELAKIRAERERAKEKAEAEAAAEEQDRMEEAALIGNPLLNLSASSNESGKLKRRWNDDVVFRNQSKGEPDQNKKRFINDTVRNDFHKRFLDKFIK